MTNFEPQLKRCIHCLQISPECEFTNTWEFYDTCPKCEHTSRDHELVSNFDNNNNNTEKPLKMVMIEIKFRAKSLVSIPRLNIKVGDFVQGSFIKTNVDAPCIVFGKGEQVEIDPRTLEQFTNNPENFWKSVYEDEDPNQCTNQRHEWKMNTPSGMYDDIYTCQKCGETHMESADNPATKLPVEGCVGQPTLNSEIHDAPDPALAALTYAFENPSEEPLEFLRCWYDGDFQAIRDEWENVPDAVFIGADPLFKPKN